MLKIIFRRYIIKSLTKGITYVLNEIKINVGLSCSLKLVQTKTIWLVVILHEPRHDFETYISRSDPTLHSLISLFIYHLITELNLPESCFLKCLNRWMHWPELSAKWFAVVYGLGSFFSGSFHIDPSGLATHHTL